MPKLPSGHRRGKTTQWNYDFIEALTDEVNCPYYLTEREVFTLLTAIETVNWNKRWFSPNGIAVPQDFIQKLQANLAQKLIIDPDCPEEPCEDGCLDYLPNSAFITYAPNDPFRTPDYTPPGYLLPPWYKNAGIPLPGVIPSDAMVNFLGIPNAFAVPTVGFPRCRVSWSGSGQVEIEFVQIPQGGLALVTWDDNPLTLEVIDLTSIGAAEVLSLGFVLGALGIETDAQVVNTRVQEYDFTTPGAHHIDVTFIPNVGIIDEFVVGMGGGIRRVSLCGIMEGTMPGVAFRFVAGCELEVSYNDGVDYAPVPGWETFAPGCFTGAPGADGADGAPGADGAQGIQGEPGVSWTMKCATAQAIINGLVNQKLNITWETIDSGIQASYTLEQIRVSIASFWPEQSGDCSDRFDSLIQDALDIEAIAPGQWRVAFEGALMQTTKNRIMHGLSCWLCESGQFPGNPQIFLNAALELLEFTDEQMFISWIGFAMQCNRAVLSQIASQYTLYADCADCSTLEGVSLDCADWNLAFGAWSIEFDFNVQSDHWFPVSSGSEKSKYVANHGFQPFSGGGSENNSCIRIFSDTDSYLLTQITIGLEAGYPVDGHLKISTTRISDSFEEVYETDFDADTDFFTVPYIDSVAYSIIDITITRQSGGCTTDMTPQPCIRYVILDGQSPPPF